MPDIENEVRALLQRRAADVGPHLEIPPSLPGRARRRLAMRAVAIGAVGIVVIAGLFTGLQHIGTVSSVTPGGSASVAPSGAASSVCTSDQLSAAFAIWEGAAGSRMSAINLENVGTASCTLEGTPDIALLDPSGAEIASGVTFVGGPADWVVNGKPKPSGWPVATLAPGDRALARLGWSNWCGSDPSPSWRFTLPGGGIVDLGQADPPPCNGPGEPSTIEVGPYEPA
jgi:Protein of unknown function (DUF4232)